MSDGAGHYAEHYDATQGKGLCWSGCGRKVFKYIVTLSDGTKMRGESLWCLECRIEDGDIVDERDARPA
jgi:hypothetical protein